MVALFHTTVLRMAIVLSGTWTQLPEKKAAGEMPLTRREGTIKDG